MNPLSVSSKRVQRFEGKLNICKGKQLSVPGRTGVTSLVGKNNKLNVAGDNVKLGLCDSRDYFGSHSANKLKNECTEIVADIFLYCVI